MRVGTRSGRENAQMRMGVALATIQDYGLTPNLGLANEFIPGHVPGGMKFADSPTADPGRTGAAPDNATRVGI
jgi:hypothetical protein